MRAEIEPLFCAIYSNRVTFYLEKIINFHQPYTARIHRHTRIIMYIVQSTTRMLKLSQWKEVVFFFVKGLEYNEDWFLLFIESCLAMTNSLFSTKTALMETSKVKTLLGIPFLTYNRQLKPNGIRRVLFTKCSSTISSILGIFLSHFFTGPQKI